LSEDILFNLVFGLVHMFINRFSLNEARKVETIVYSIAEKEIYKSRHFNQETKKVIF